MRKEPRDALFALVEATRAMPRERRGPLLGFVELGSTHVDFHHGLPDGHPGIYPTDLEDLHRASLIIARHDGASWTVDVTSRGFDAYEELRTELDEPTQRIEDAVISYIDAPGFRARHATAFEKWNAAQQILWHSDSDADFSAIGHYCREAAQNFASSLLKLHPAPDAPSDPQLSKNRVAAVLQAHRHGSSRVDALADAMLALWDKAIALAQRQEHGSYKGGDPLKWEDGRRLVFIMMVAMSEIDRLLSTRP